MHFDSSMLISDDVKFNRLQPQKRDFVRFKRILIGWLSHPIRELVSSETHLSYFLTSGVTFAYEEAILNIKNNDS